MGNLTGPGILDNMWKIVDAAIRQKHGALLIISSDAKGEAERLNNQSTRIRATKLNWSLVGNVTSMDGTTLLDIAGTFYTIRVILDGKRYLMKPRPNTKGGTGKGWGRVPAQHESVLTKRCAGASIPASQGTGFKQQYLESRAGRSRICIL